MSNMTSSDSGLQPTIVIVTILAPCIALIFVMLRLYTRFAVTNTLNWEDSLIVVSMLLCTGMTYADIKGTYAGYLGYHQADIDWSNYDGEASGKYRYAMILVYNPILALVKDAMLLLYLRLEGGTMDNLRRTIKVVIAVNTALMIAIFMSSVLSCIPVSKNWSPTKPGHCIDGGAFYTITAACTILTDIPVLVIPSWMFYGLNMAWKRKVTVVAVLSLGFIVTGVSIYRLYYMIVSYYGAPNPDPTYTAGGLSTIVEVNLAIIAACVPTLKPLVKRWLPAPPRVIRAKEPQYTDNSNILVTIGGSVWIRSSKRATVDSTAPGTDALQLHAVGGQYKSLRRSGVSDVSDEDSEKAIVNEPGRVPENETRIDVDVNT